MVQPIRSLDELARHGGCIHAECRQCGRLAIFAVHDLLAHFRRRKLTLAWPRFAKHIRCSPPDGCGARDPEVAWVPNPPPPDDDPPPPRPRFVRAGPPAPLGVDQREWNRARDDRERRRLIRQARG
jgi:hypothetical protein